MLHNTNTYANQCNMKTKIDAKERTRRALETRAENQAKWSRQRIEIDDQFSIVRFDELNWQIQKDGKPFPRENYYGTLHGAFRGLPAAMLQPDSKTHVAEFIAMHRHVFERIDNVLSRL